MDKEIDARIQALIQQRDNANNQVVLLSGKIAVLEAENAELKKSADPPLKEVKGGGK